MLLPDTSLRGALRCAERVRKAVVRRPFDGLHQVTVSIGIAEYRPGETVSSLIGRADEALYGAKNAGRNRVHCATDRRWPERHRDARLPRTAHNKKVPDLSCWLR